jgi:hypothetical protein
VLPGPTRCGNGCSVHLPPEGANVERAEGLPLERYAVKIIFLGIFTHSPQGICAVNKLMLQSMAGG